MSELNQQVYNLIRENIRLPIANKLHITISQEILTKVGRTIWPIESEIGFIPPELREQFASDSLSDVLKQTSIAIYLNVDRI